MPTVNRVTGKAPTAIREPKGHPDDVGALRVEGDKVLPTKGASLDIAYLKAVDASLVDEWASDEDNEAFDDL